MNVIIFRIGHLITGILLLFLLIIPFSMCNGDVTNSHVHEHDKVLATINKDQSKFQNTSEKISDAIHHQTIKHEDKVILQQNNTANAIHTKNITNKNIEINNVELINNKPPNHSPELDSGAMIRGFYVFIGMSVIVIAYLIFRSFRLRNSPAQMVRKYGVLAHKQDIEMRPLPLDDDDDDDTTVFDASRLPLRSDQTA